MLRRSRGTGRTGPIIELSIPMRLVRNGREDGAEAGGEEDVSCYICANAVCVADECCRTLTHLGCCTQTICCGCLLKSSKRCTCKEECDAVISLCPFCREVSPVEALDVFLGGRPPCAACVKADHAAAPAAPRPSPESHDSGAETDAEDVE